MFTSVSCVIVEYILDNDNDRATPVVPINGLSGNPVLAPCGNVRLCRTVLFDTNSIRKYTFWIHIVG